MKVFAIAAVPSEASKSAARDVFYRSLQRELLLAPALPLPLAGNLHDI